MIDRSTGLIKPSRPLDFEKFSGSNSNDSVRKLTVTVRASDFGIPKLYTEVSCHVYLKDANDNSPIFEEASYNVSIPEDLSEGTAILKVRRREYHLL